MYIYRYYVQRAMSESLTCIAQRHIYGSIPVFDRLIYPGAPLFTENRCSPISIPITLRRLLSIDQLWWYHSRYAGERSNFVPLSLPSLTSPHVIYLLISLSNGYPQNASATKMKCRRTTLNSLLPKLKLTVIIIIHWFASTMTFDISHLVRDHYPNTILLLSSNPLALVTHAH